MTADRARSSSPDRERRTPEQPRREPIQQDAPGEPVSGSEALETRCRQVTANLREALGPDGCSALLTRALAECETKHPVLKHVRGPDEREIQLDGVAAAVAQHGLGTVEAGVGALFASLLGILERLIGEDMALRLIDFDARESSPDEEPS